MLKKTETEVATLLQNQGQLANIQDESNLKELVQRFGPTSLWHLVIAEALIWTEHARRDDAFIRQAIQYLQTGSSTHLASCRPFSNREGLLAALEGWYKINNLLTLLPSINLQICGAAELYDLQKEALTIQSQNHFAGIGVWLLCGPFKILALLRSDLWRDVDLDQVLMPPGKPSINGAKSLLRKGYNFGEKLTPEDLSPTEKDFADSLATLLLLHNWCEKIAPLVSGQVIHINTGLHLLGEKKISL